MHNTAIHGRADVAATVGIHRCVFFCEYVARDKRWIWSWRPATHDPDTPFTEPVFASLSDCLLDAARHGFQRDHIRIRYPARQPCLSLLEKFDDRSKEFIRALKNLIPSGKLKHRPIDPTYSETWRDSSSEEHRTWRFSGSPQTLPRDLSGTTTSARRR